MTLRNLFLVLIPCLVVGCGMESEPEDFRTVPVDEPCMVEDCVPLDPGPPETVCPPDTELTILAECIDGNGTCEWDIAEVCVPIAESGGEEQPPEEPPPPPHGSGTTPRDVAPPTAA